MTRLGRSLAVAAVFGMLLTSCGGLSQRTFETLSGSWVLYTQPRIITGGRDAQVLGALELDEASGCVYLHQPEFDISYPTVWPAGTVVTDTGLRLDDGRELAEGDRVSGGGGYVDVDELEGGADTPQAGILERCPGVNNDFGEVAEFDSSAGELEIGE